MNEGVEYLFHQQTSMPFPTIWQVVNEAYSSHDLDI